VAAPRMSGKIAGYGLCWGIRWAMCLWNAGEGEAVLGRFLSSWFLVSLRPQADAATTSLGRPHIFLQW
jgi:hypothetical protein